VIRRLLRRLLGVPAEVLHPEDVPGLLDVTAAQALQDPPDPADFVLDLPAFDVLTEFAAMWALPTVAHPAEPAAHLTDTEESL
jgi:hypothetical protein